MSRPHETASSATTSAPLKRPNVPLVDERLSSLSAAPAFTRAAWSAGNPPATRLESTIRPSTNSMIR
jgi:hypothetical protein